MDDEKEIDEPPVRFLTLGFLREIVEAWSAERDRHSTDLASLRDMYDDEHKARIALQGEILRLKMNLADACAERNGLQAKLDASTPLPLDADGVPCHIGDEIQPIGMKSFEVKKIIYNGRQKQEMVGPNGAGEYYFADICRHDAPKPESIDDVRKDATDAFGFGGIEPMIDRAYACGKRDGGDHD